MIIDEASQILQTSLPQGLRLEIKRSFAHLQLKSACKAFIEANVIKTHNASAKTKLPAAIEGNLTFPLEPNLVAVLNAFVALQEARHEADYDLSSQWGRVGVLAHVANVETAFAGWHAVRKTPNASVFMSTLIPHPHFQTRPKVWVNRLFWLSNSAYFSTRGRSLCSGMLGMRS